MIQFNDKFADMKVKIDNDCGVTQWYVVSNGIKLVVASDITEQ